MADNTGEPRLHGGLRLMHIAGIQITIDPSWFLIFLLVVFSLSAGYFPRQFPGQSSAAYWVAGLLATLLFFGSILVHELAHALMAIRVGMHIPEITLFIFGGVSRLSEEARDPKTEFTITAALSQMSQAGSGRLLVVQDATVRGMITKTGLLRFLEIKQILGQAGPQEF